MKVEIEPKLQLEQSLVKINAISITIPKPNNFINNKHHRTGDELVIQNNKFINQELKSKILTFDYSSKKNRTNYLTKYYTSIKKCDEILKDNFKRNYKMIQREDNTPKGGLNVLLGSQFSNKFIKKESHKKEAQVIVQLHENLYRSLHNTIKNEMPDYEDIYKVKVQETDNETNRNENRINQQKNNLKEWIKSNFYPKK